MPREKRALYVELLVTVGLMVAPALVQSIYFFSHPEKPLARPEDSAWYFSVKVLTDLLLIGLLWHIVRLNGESFADFSLPFAGKDLLRGFGLFVWVTVSYYATYRLLFSLGVGASQSRSLDAFRVPFSAWYLLAMVVNPFLEESFVRGFLQTRLKQAGWSAAAAVGVATLLQASYHLYQGLLPCLCFVPVFFFFALYYQSSRRLWPVYLAHMILDVLAMLSLMKSGGATSQAP